MAQRGVDVLVLGRQDDATYASGATRLWTSGTRPFGAGCVVVAATGRAHVLSSWDAGIPESIRFEDLYPLTWNPRNMAASLAAIDGFTTARRIGVDAMSPSFLKAAAQLAPDAEVLPVDDMLSELRQRKSPEEIAAIRAACTAAWIGIDAAVESGAVGPALEALAAAGVTVPSSGVSVARDGDAVVVDVGVLVDGYEGGAGGRFVDGDRGPAPAIVHACRAGATWDDLAAAATDPAWCVRGVGLGFEQPVLTADVGRSVVLAESMVLSASDGPYRDIVAVTAEGADVLS
jgi:Xaa-Pro aminopeptidase